MILIFRIGKSMLAASTPAFGAAPFDWEIYRILSKIGGSRKMPGRKIALNLRGLIFLPHIFLLKPGPVRDTPPRIFETIQFIRLPESIIGRDHHHCPSQIAARVLVNSNESGIAPSPRRSG
jgi:hypothetical protein